jgi:hypothetical protein
MSESGDYSPGVWKGHDFTSARRAYDSHVGRSYDAAVSAGKATKDLIEPNPTTESTCGGIIVIDETGSMGDWPGTIFSKLPYLENEAKEYLGEDYEICFMAIGDANCSGEKYPLQVRPFAHGLDLEKRLKELVIEGGGGGQQTETYELAAFAALECVKMPKAIKPYIIFIGDEKCYDYVDPDHIQNLLGIKLEKSLSTAELFKKLTDKYSVYLIRKSYGTSGGNDMSADDKEITRHWAALIGEDHISNLPKAERVVDVIFGIWAKETNRIAYFENELEDRQLADKDGDAKVDLVYKSLATIHRTPSGDGKAHTGKSIMRKSVGKSKAAPSLI